jgi:hypothetical protein
MKMEIDEKEQESDAVEHVEIFLNLIEDNSKKIKSMSKVLPHLIDNEDVEAL